MAPTISVMKLLHPACEKFSIDFGIFFNSQKSEVILFGSFASDIKLKFFNNILVTKTKVKYLGHFLSAESRDILSIKSTILDLKIRSNVILSNFNFLNLDSKIEIFNANCTNYYGCQLINLYSGELKDLDKAWRVCIRRLVGIPARTHNYLLAPIINTCSPTNAIKSRIYSLFVQGLNSSSTLIKHFFINCIVLKESIIYKNLLLLGADFGVNVDTLICMSSNVVKKYFTCVTHDWRSNIIREILKYRDGDLHSLHTDQEITQALNILCTF